MRFLYHFFICPTSFLFERLTRWNWMDFASILFSLAVCYLEFLLLYTAEPICLRHWLTFFFFSEKCIWFIVRTVWKIKETIFADRRLQSVVHCQSLRSLNIVGVFIQVLFSPRDHSEDSNYFWRSWNSL